ncbi:MAG: lipoyl domain-containing protein [Erysipelothrix sp.]|jgi:pyruvate/2-oxoglutarate dehydrogenase complex dihydrolipoamide acyltransferase (E2) component|nr:lipoyl domain-containing protein [Erysipelothrix sp.]
MKYEVKVPLFAEGATKIKIRQWLFEIGDEVKAGDNLVEATTDKISINIEAVKSGFLVEKLVEEDDTVLIDQVIAIISDKKED